MCNDIEKLKRLILEGKNKKEIAESFETTPTSVHRWMKKYHLKCVDGRQKYDDDFLKKFQKEYDSGMNTEELMKKYKVAWGTIRKAQLSGKLKFRNKSERMKLMMKNNPNHPFVKNPKFDKNRKLARDRMKKRIDDDPNNHPNRKVCNNRKRMTYPERLVYDYLTEKKIPFKHNDYIKPYWPDFRIGKKIIEVDGEYWHDADKDKLRDENLNKMGYTVYRFKAKEINKDVSIIDSVL
jgi:very-short-patch-repair endonuclease